MATGTHRKDLRNPLLSSRTLTSSHAASSKSSSTAPRTLSSSLVGSATSLKPGLLVSKTSTVGKSSLVKDPSLVTKLATQSSIATQANPSLVMKSGLTTSANLMSTSQTTLKSSSSSSMGNEPKLVKREDLLSHTGLRSDLRSKPGTLSKNLTGGATSASLTSGRSLQSSALSTRSMTLRGSLTKTTAPLIGVTTSSSLKTATPLKTSTPLKTFSTSKTSTPLAGGLSKPGSLTQPGLLPSTSIKPSTKMTSLLATSGAKSTLQMPPTSLLTTTQTKTSSLLAQSKPSSFLGESQTKKLLTTSMKASRVQSTASASVNTKSTLLSTSQTTKPLPSTLSTQTSLEAAGKRHDAGSLAKEQKSPENLEIETKIAQPITDDTEGAPEYSFSSQDSKPTKKQLQFLSPEAEVSSQTASSATVDIVGLKTTILNAVAASLLASPDFHDSKDPTLRALASLGEKIACHDPEFVLKVAIYTRQELNIRTTANFLLALAAKLPSCRPYLRKYFSASVRLPSDWIEVAEIYQALHDTNIKHGSIPTALRKVMCTKFTDFDAFQLAKYNKDGSKKKKSEKIKKMKEEKDKGKEKKYKADFPSLKHVVEDSDSDSDSDSSVVLSDSENKEELEKLSFTLKQLIRKIHICDPVEHVMSLVGKKYPEDPEAFRRSRLPGMWEESRAGKRMKLPVPETWETQVSTKGNKASTWQDLIDHNKLPFMAMLRNIRNLIMAGVKPKYHMWVVKRLGDEQAVINSRQFPFRFFSAYQVLEEMEKIASGEAVPQRAPSKGKGGKGGKKSKKPPKEMPTIEPRVLQRYKNALDTALKIATCHNVKPIGGSTLILCNVGSNMDRPCTAARGLGKPRKVYEVAVLLGLMCKYSCERSTMVVYGNGLTEEMELKDGTILDNMENVKNVMAEQTLDSGVGTLPMTFLMEFLTDRKQVDNIVLLSDTMNLNDEQGRAMMGFLQKYRHLVNPNLLFVSVDLSAGKAGVSSTIKPEHPNDIYLAGYSDQILRFIAERGDSGQLTHVDNIDKVHNLTHIKIPSLAESAAPGVMGNLASLASEKALMSATRSRKWRSVRVFISSTFRDMHGERDLLTRFVFPELRARAHNRHIHVYEVDLRWGITETDARSHKALEICLQEISKSQYFIGLLGQRYGWIQDEYNVPDSPEFDWLKELPKRKSITEVEMHHAALSDTDKAVGKAFFYFRDPTFLNTVPPQLRGEFDSESEEAQDKIEALKSRIRESGLEVFDNYPCHWLGKVQEKPMVGGLEGFGQRVLYNLWNAILKDYPEDDVEEDEITMAAAQHSAFEETRASTFIGRQALLQKAQQVMKDPESRLVLITGKPGCGKSAFMATLAQQYNALADNFSVKPVLSHFVGAAPGSSNIALLLTRLCHEMKRRFGVGKSVPEDYTDLARDWPSFLEEAVTNVGKVGFKIVVMIDGTDLLEDKHNGRSLDWIPASIPQGTLILLSGVEGGTCVANLRKRKYPPEEFKIGPLDMFDKAEMVRKKLEKHRKALDESPFNNQMKLLLTKKEANNPLYLHLACEELRFFGVFEEVTAYLKKIPTTISSLLQDILQRLEEEHSAEVLSTALLLLTLVRNGLLEHELAGVLQLASKENTNKTWSLSPMVMSKLLRNIQTFLQPTGEEELHLLILAHKDIEKAVKLRYMRGADSTKGAKLHQLLSRYFRADADPAGDGSFKGNSGRAFIELPYHLMEAGSWKELESLVCNIRFVIAKCELGLAHQLLEDYMPTMEGVSSGKARELSKFIQQPAVQEFKSFVSRNLHVLLQNPSLTLQQALNEPTSSQIAESAKIISREQSKSMMLWVNKPQDVSPCLMNLPSSTGPVLSVDVSNDSSQFAAGFKNGAVKVYEMATGKEVHTFIGHAGGVAAVCFVGSEFVCSASLDSTLSLWSTSQGIRITSMKGHSRPVHGCKANKVGQTIVSVSWDTTIKVWEGRTGKLKTTLKTQGQHNTPINCVSFHPEGQLVVVGSWDSTLKIWDTFNQKRLKVLKGHGTSVQACEYAPSGRHIVSAALDGEVKVWSTKSGTAVGTIVGHHSPVNDIAFTPNGQYLVTASSDKMLKVWSGSMGRRITSIGSEDLGFVHRLVYDHQTQLVCAGYHDGHVRQFNMQTGSEVFAVRQHQAAIVGLAQHTDLFMSASVDGSMKVWKKELLNKVVELKGHTSPISCAVWDKNGFASASEDFTIMVWPHDYRSYNNKLTRRSTAARKKGKGRQEPQQASEPGKLEVTATFQTHGQHTGKITSIAFSSDGLRMAVAGHDRKITVWNCLGNTLERSLTDCHKDWITACCFSDISPNILITGSSDYTLKTWDLSSGAGKTTFKGHTSAINSVTMSHGCVVSAAFDGSVKVWTHKAVEITTMFCHKQRVNTCHIHIPDKAQDKMAGSAWADIDEGETAGSKVKLGEILVMTGSDDGSVRVWKPFLPNEIATLTGHSDRVLSVGTTLNNQVLSSSLDCSLRIWRFPLPAAGLTLISSTSSHAGAVTSLSGLTAADELSYLVSGGRDGYSTVWKVDKDNFIKLYDVKESDSNKAVTSVCLTKSTSDRGEFAVGSNNGSFSVYHFSQQQTPTKDRSLSPSVLMGTLPLSKLVLGPDKKTVFAASWSSQLAAITTNKSSANQIMYRMNHHKDWVMDFIIAGSSVYSISLDGHMICWQLPRTLPSGTQMNFVQASDIKKFPLRLKTGEERGSVWPLSLCEVQGTNYIVISDSKGQVSLWNKTINVLESTRKVHAKQVNVVAPLGNRSFLTGSDDGTVKAWKITKKPPRERLTQIGQFYGQSCITAITTFRGEGEKRKNTPTMLAVGDSLGHVTLLEWQE